MNFDLTFTPEQEQFRVQVREWLEIHAPKDLEQKADPGELTHRDYLKQRKLGRDLGEQGGSIPYIPKSMAAAVYRRKRRS